MYWESVVLKWQDVALGMSRMKSFLSQMDCKTAQGMMGQFQYDLCHTEQRNSKKHNAKGECLLCLPAGLFTLSILLCAPERASVPAAWL
jgi:hypothetical protein